MPPQQASAAQFTATARVKSIKGGSKQQTHKSSSTSYKRRTFLFAMQPVRTKRWEVVIYLKHATADYRINR